MAGSGKESRGFGRKVVVVLMLLSIGCGVWIAVSFFRMSGAKEQLARDKVQVEDALPIAKDIVALVGRESGPRNMTENELDRLINDTVNATGLRWRAIQPLPNRPAGSSVEVTRQIDMDENDVTTILNFLVMLKSQKPDLSISRLNLNAVGRSRRLWTGGFDITMVQRAGS